jgi:hypothetical protein
VADRNRRCGLGACVSARPCFAAGSCANILPKLAKGCCKSPDFEFALRRPEIFAGSALPSAADLPGSLAISNQTLTGRSRTWWPSIIQPRWTIIRNIRDQESTFNRKEFQWAGATSKRCRNHGPQSSAAAGNKFALTQYQSMLRGLWTELRVNRTMRVPQQEGNSDRKEEPTQPSLPRHSASRARWRFRSLFNSASSRKYSCSFCQAATPSRVASSAPFGT